MKKCGKTREHDIKMLENEGKVETCGKEVVFWGEEFGEEEEKAWKVNTEITKNERIYFTKTLCWSPLFNFVKCF